MRFDRVNEEICTFIFFLFKIIIEIKKIRFFMVNFETNYYTVLHRACTNKIDFVLLFPRDVN
jgi:hypothetical protein